MTAPQLSIEGRPGRSRAVRFLSALWKAPFSAWFGLALVVAYGTVAILAPWIAPYKEMQVFSQSFAPWGSEFPFGTDQVGRDILTRLIYGARNTIGIAFATTLLSFAVGVALGLLAAMKRGWVDQMLSRAIDALMSIPSLIFSLMLLSIFGSSIPSLILIIALLDSTRVFRLARATGLNIVVMEYVEAARLRGESTTWIIYNEILPNIMPPLIAEFGLRFCFVFLTISALSFLGVGIQPPTADWGSMVRENAALITYGDITPLLPAGAIALLTIAVNFVVDWLLHATSGLRDEKCADLAPKRGAQLLRISDLSIEGYSDDRWHPILRGISLTLNRGEVLGLIGESGAGKSTLALAAMGFVVMGCRKTSGTVVFDGVDLALIPESERRDLRGSRIAYVAQSAAASFNPAHRLIDQTIETALAHGVASREEARRRAISLYRRLRLPDPEWIGLRYPHQVSGGQLQRVMTAMAMICQPDLIILDEPTTALDVTTQVDVLASIRGIVEDSGTAAIYVTHDLAVVAQMAHRIMVLRNGLVVEEAATRQMLTSPTDEYTRTLWAVRKLGKQESLSDSHLLTLQGVSAAYSRVRVLHDASITVPRGRTVAVVGESGSGKSTLARVISGLLPPETGTMRFDGEVLPRSMEERPRELLRRIQMVYQSPENSLNPRRTVRQVVARPLDLYFGLRGVKRDHRLAELMRMIELDETYLDRLPSELSGGQKQRIGIARALAAQPELIVCDEVTSALDQITQEEILKLLIRLQRELQVSYLFITHDIATVRAIADEIVVMHQGRVIEQGPKSRVLTPPHEPYTELLLSSVPEMDPDWLTRVLDERTLHDGDLDVGR
jgi:ABC-type glutathione transport system ATPase component/ABC-type dipeptide/oligopeptide/nickel transport system permease subunit